MTVMISWSDHDPRASRSQVTVPPPGLPSLGQDPSRSAGGPFDSGRLSSLGRTTPNSESRGHGHLHHCPSQRLLFCISSLLPPLLVYSPLLPLSSQLALLPIAPQFSRVPGHPLSQHSLRNRLLICWHGQGTRSLTHGAGHVHPVTRKNGFSGGMDRRDPP